MNRLVSRKAPSSWVGTIRHPSPLSITGRNWPRGPLWLPVAPLVAQVCELFPRVGDPRHSASFQPYVYVFRRLMCVMSPLSHRELTLFWLLGVLSVVIRDVGWLSILSSRGLFFLAVFGATPTVCTEQADGKRRVGRSLKDALRAAEAASSFLVILGVVLARRKDEWGGV